MAHLHVNTADFLDDHEVAMPLRALDEFVADGVVGSSAQEHVSVMGYQAAGLDEWRNTAAPEIAAMLHEQGVDGVVIAPNCPDCCKNVPVLARRLEDAGIPTVLVTMMPDIAERLLAPRIVGVEFPFGHAFGPAKRPRHAAARARDRAHGAERGSGGGHTTRRRRRVASRRAGSVPSLATRGAEPDHRPNAPQVACAATRGAV